MFRFSQTRASPSQTHALWTFDQHSATCARSVLPAGSAAHNSVLGCVYGKARSAAHTGVLKQLGSCNRKLSAVPASTRSGRCFQSQKQRNCSSPGQSSQTVAPATKSAHGRSQSAAPATKSGHGGSQSAMPATKSALQETSENSNPNGGTIPTMPDHDPSMIQE